MRYALLGFAVLTACLEHGPLPPSPQPDQSDAIDACKPACQQLRFLGCPEGSPSVSGNACEATCARALELRDLPLRCWADADSVAELRACGSIRCVR